ncbi:MAG: Unknown protein [uncultured Aureispira sp.]|uniref:DUF4412 domain-containing protein n=1 Tax=uncultured Aureispira sp. TaxID=1331704 RepID=A0A6S6T3M4_9BACT|nr:MAG: Unknown protein [uncultured Aureispira sp.]
MKQVINILLALMMCFGVLTSATAQKKKAANFDEGIIKYKIEIEGMPEAAQVLDNAMINLYLKGDNSKMDLSILGGLASFQLINNTAENLFSMLMDIPTVYDKTAVSLDEDSDFLKELKELRGTNQAPKNDVKVKYFKSQKQKIAKYPCYKAEIGLGDGSNDKLTVFLTEKLRPTALAQLEKTLGDFKGFPLSFQIEMQGVVLKITAVDVAKQKIGAETFTIPESYNKKTMDEFKEEIETKMGTGDGGVGL